MSSAGLRQRLPPWLFRPNISRALSLTSSSVMFSAIFFLSIGSFVFLQASVYGGSADAHHGCYLAHCHGSGFVQSPHLLDLLLVEAYGRLPVLPLALAASSPARVRSRIRSRSNWANDPKMLNMSVPPGVLVSIDSVSERN